MKHKGRVYIIGAREKGPHIIPGYDRAHFAAAADKLRDLGYVPYDPVQAEEELGDGAVVSNFDRLLDHPAYTLLQAWETDPVAVTELLIARVLGLEYVEIHWLKFCAGPQAFTTKTPVVKDAALTLRFIVEPFAIENPEELQRWYHRSTVTALLSERKDLEASLAAAHDTTDRFEERIRQLERSLEARGKPTT